MCCSQAWSKGETLSHVLICCNLSQMFDLTIRGRHQHLTPQRTVLPQHFCKWGLSIEAATLHRLPHTSLCVGGRSFHISRWCKNWIFLLQYSIESINHIARRLSWAQRVIGEKQAFSPWNTRLIYESLLVFVAASCVKGVFFFLKRSRLKRQPIEPNLAVLDRMPYIRSQGRVITHFPLTAHTHNYTLPAGI